MLAVIAKLNVAEGKEEAFEEVMLNLAAQVRATNQATSFIRFAKTRTATTSSWSFIPMPTHWLPMVARSTSKPRVEDSKG